MRKGILKFTNQLYEEIVSKLPFGFSPFPRTVTFELLYACNLNCSMCYLRVEEVKKGLKPKKILTLIQTKKIIDKIPFFTSITFTGGEPLLRKDIFQILEYAAQKHRIGLISNLVLADEEKINKLLDLNLNTLMFSLDGDEYHHEKIRGKGNFIKTVKNASNLIKFRNEKGKEKPIVTLNCVIQPSTVNCLSKVAQQAVKIGVDICNFQLLDPSLDRSGYNLQVSLDHLEKNLITKVPIIAKRELVAQLGHVKKILQEKGIKLSFTPKFTKNQIIDYYQRKINVKRLFCSEPYYSLRISPFGDVYPCYNLSIGNLLEQSFWSLWNSSRVRSFRKSIKKGRYMISCIGCCHLCLKNL